MLFALSAQATSSSENSLLMSASSLLAKFSLIESIICLKVPISLVNCVLIVSLGNQVGQKLLDLRASISVAHFARKSVCNRIQIVAYVDFHDGHIDIVERPFREQSEVSGVERFVRGVEAVDNQAEQSAFEIQHVRAFGKTRFNGGGEFAGVVADVFQRVVGVDVGVGRLIGAVFSVRLEPRRRVKQLEIAYAERNCFDVAALSRRQLFIFASGLPQVFQDIELEPFNLGENVAEIFFEAALNEVDSAG